MESTLASIVAAASPLIFATMGETISEKSGVINLSMEGSLRLSAMTGFVVALWAGHALVARDRHPLGSCRYLNYRQCFGRGHYSHRQRSQRCW